MYVDQQHRLRWIPLTQALALGEGFVKVTGEVGTGKTLLCRRLMAHLPASVVTACIFNPGLTLQACCANWLKSWGRCQQIRTMSKPCTV